MSPTLAHYYKIFIEFPRVSFALYSFQMIFGVTTYGDQTIKFTNAPYKKVPFFLSFCIFPLIAFLPVILMSPYWDVLDAQHR